MRGSRTMRYGIAAAAVLLVVASPYLGIPYWRPSLAVFVALFAIGAVGVNMMFGYAGMLSLGNAMFLGMSAYTMGLFHAYLGVPVVFAAIIGVAATTVVAALIGVVFVRISGVYFAVGTLGLAVAFEGLVRAFPAVTGGASGLTISRRLELGFVTVNTETGWYVLASSLAVVVGVIAYYLATGRTGRLLRLVRHDQLAASVFGLNVPRAKLVVFVISAAVTAAAGVVLFLWQGVVVPESSGLLESVELVAMAVVGGVGHWAGPFLGALAIEGVNDVVRTLGQYREILFGLVFLTVALFAQRGVVGLLAGSGRWMRRLLRRPVAAPAAEVGFRAKDADSGSRTSTSITGSGLPLDSWRSADPLERGLQIEDATKRFGGLVAVERASIRVPRGAVTGLIGSNGAGKSTLMNIISGIEGGDEGRVWLHGRDITEEGPGERARAGLARTFQVPRLVSNLTVVDNVSLGADAVNDRVFRRRPAEERATVDRSLEALETAGLGRVARRRAHELGSGERKFVELVRALAWQPTVLLMDEPAVGLIDEEIALLHQWLSRMRSEDAAVLLVDHNMDFVGEVADYVYLMDNGRIVAQGEPGQIVEILKGTAPVPGKETFTQ